MMSLWDALRMNMMISYQELVRTFLRGLYTIAEGMVMFGRDGEIWAIYLNDGEIRYFTNVHKWKKTIPKTFEQWRERFPEIEINYGGDISTLPTQEDL
ncbi:hypothetical protein HUC35_22905 [Escherichia coli]|uniref:hypothetical protein n=1 Tax=Escherichia coli TaxID=562 RepID=UPI00157D63A3|nr:hypothetical protein [Escherichia coli]NUC70591.1 hypothetical protein [Escherichia coli]